VSTHSLSSSKSIRRNIQSINHRKIARIPSSSIQVSLAPDVGAEHDDEDEDYFNGASADTSSVYIGLGPGSKAEDGEGGGDVEAGGNAEVDDAEIDISSLESEAESGPSFSFTLHRYIPTSADHVLVLG
jgi:hypothetical protein